jgi:hypothetical protein
MRDYTDCYAILGLPPDTDWETLRTHYRRLIGQWHPDRFSADTAQQKLAEERSKQITGAYRALEKFHRDHGALPPLRYAVALAAARRPVRDADPASDRDAAKDRSGTGATGAAERRPARWRRAALALSALIAVPYLAYRYLDAWAPDDNRPEHGAAEPGVAQPAPRVAESPGEQPGISTGSTFGDVHAIQGIPTLTEGDTWHYGRSQVRFAHGKVVSWNEDPDNPLRIARNQRVQLQGGNFKLGSTKDEVRATQGTPVTETATVWDYGLSRVYFEHNRVVRWEESPMQPLRVKR